MVLFDFYIAVKFNIVKLKVIQVKLDNTHKKFYEQRINMISLTLLYDYENVK